jgi:serine/threonine protein phosphatase PrpC
MTYTWASGSHVGRIRSSNEDSVHPETAGTADELLAVVADGMGGAAAGEVASATALDAVLSADTDVAERVRSANRAVHALATARRELAGMGTTVTAVRLEPDGTARFGHVGDSRAYLLRDGRLEQLTADHTVVAEWMATGAITAEEAKTHPRRGMLTRSVGVAPEVVVDSFTQHLEPGDRMLLCSDGLNGMISDDTIASLLGEGEPEVAVWRLIEAANSAGGHDNVTVLVIDVTR